MAHRNARTTIYARRLIVQRHHGGWPAARIAEQLGISRATVHKWIARHNAEGDAGLADRPSRPHTMPTRTPAETETRVLALRTKTRRGAAYLAGELGLVASTVGRILHRHQVPALAVVDPITGELVRRRHTGIRYERRNPGDLLHIDVKKLGRVPAGWRLAAAGPRGHHGPPAQAGPDRLRLPPRRRGRPDPAGLRRGVARRARPDLRGVPAPRRDLVPRPRRGGAADPDRQRHGLPPRRQLDRRVRGPRAAATVHQTGLPMDQRQSRTVQPHPAHRTLLTEFAYAQPWTSNDQRCAALPDWVTNYNTRRAHSALGGRPPISRLAS